MHQRQERDLRRRVNAALTIQVRAKFCEVFCFHDIAILKKVLVSETSQTISRAACQLKITHLLSGVMIRHPC